MRLVFAGTPEFAAVHLRALIGAAPAEGHQLVGVLTQPDRAAGRGLSLTPTPVRQLAEAAGLPVLTPSSLRADKPGGPEAQADLAALLPDLLIVVAYGLLLPQAVLDIPRFGCINVHASLLPRWRGAAPIQRAIEAGDAQTGICLMKMEAGLDTGPIWSTHPLAVGPHETAEELHDRLARLGAEALVTLLEDPPFFHQPPQPQAEAGVCYAAKITARDRGLDFSLPARELVNRTRALDPSPAATAKLKGHALKLGGARLVDSLGQWAAPGEIVALPSGEQQGLVVACGQGLLGLGWLQRAGGKRLSAAEFARGAGLAVGDCFETEAGNPSISG